MKTRIRTQLNYNNAKNTDVFEILTGQSLTEQSASISPREIMYRFTSGNLPEIQREDMGEDEPLTFDDYKNYHDLDYELSDLTRDRIRLLELKEEVETSLKAKEKIRKQKLQQELEEFKQYKKLQEIGDNEKAELKNTTPEKTAKT